MTLPARALPTAWGVVPLTFAIPTPSQRPLHHVQVHRGVVANGPSRGMMRIPAHGIPLMRERELSGPVRVQASAACMGLRGGSAESWRCPHTPPHFLLLVTLTATLARCLPLDASAANNNVPVHCCCKYTRSVDTHFLGHMARRSPGQPSG